jgi:hypothetical protein
MTVDCSRMQREKQKPNSLAFIPDRASVFKPTLAPSFCSIKRRGKFIREKRPRKRPSTVGGSGLPSSRTRHKQLHSAFFSQKNPNNFRPLPFSMTKSAKTPKVLQTLRLFGGKKSKNLTNFFEQETLA